MQCLISVTTMSKKIQMLKVFNMADTQTASLPNTDQHSYSCVKNQGLCIRILMEISVKIWNALSPMRLYDVEKRRRKKKGGGEGGGGCL